MRNDLGTLARQPIRSDSPPVRQIPVDRVPDHPGRTAPIAVPIPISTAAGVIGPDGRLAVEPATAALAALILRHSGATELLIGVLGTGLRVARVRLTERTTVSGLLHEVVRALAEPHAAVPESELAALLADDGTGPMCHALIGTGVPEPSGDVLRLGDLCVTAASGPDRRPTLIGNGAFYKGSTVTALAVRYGRLLDAFAAGPDSDTVGALDLLTADDRVRIMRAWNDTAEQVAPELVPELIERVAEADPDRPAVRHAGVTTSYGELDRDANRLANLLIAGGVAAGDNVGVFLPRGTANVLAQLAIFKAGAAVVLLDPEYPTQRLEFMLADSAAVAVLTQDGLAGTLPANAAGTIRVDDGAWRARPATNPRGRLTDDSISHIAYTSGSTGTPKAVMLRHGPFRNTVHVLCRQCEITADTRGTWLCSPGFGLVEVDFFPVLAAGGLLTIPDPGVAESPERLRDWLIATGTTHTLQLTAMAERLWRLPWPPGCALSSMRVAGERVRTWPPAGLPYLVLNVYGSAEANVVSTCDLGDTASTMSEGELRTRMPPVGRPVSNVRTYVLDEQRNPVPSGVLGELYVSGASLSRGYLNRPDDHAAKFLPNSLPEDPYPVLYRSGDVARWWPDGTLEIIGRTDDQTKIRGYRVQLGEIETALAEAPGVRQCAVLAREDASGDRRLVAYVELLAGAATTEPELRRSLAARLPQYMVPAAFVLMDLPTTANGKIDRAMLPAPSRTRPQLDVPYEPPRTPVEQGLAEVWSDLLEIDKIGVLDPFLELGGDSLRAMRLLSGVRERFGVDLTLAELLNDPTIAGAAQVVLRALPLDIVADPAARLEPFPLTAAQRTAWLAGGGVAGALDVYEWRRDWLDVDRLTAAWRSVAGRHDALRTVILPDGRQVAAEHAAPPALVDLRSLPEPDLPHAVDQARDRLRAGPDTRLQIVVLAEDAAVIQLGVQPLVVDPDSVLRVLVPELSAAYEGEPSPAEPVTFRDAARALAEAPVGAPDAAWTWAAGAARFGSIHVPASVWAAVCRVSGGPAEAILSSGPAVTTLDYRRPTAQPPLDEVIGYFATASGSGDVVAALYSLGSDADPTWEPDLIVSGGLHAAADLRWVAGGQGVRIHATVHAEAAPSPATLLDRCRDALARLATDGASTRKSQP